MNVLPHSRAAYDSGSFDSQLGYEGWKAPGARDPVNAINDGRSVSEFWFDGPVTGMAAEEVVSMLEASPLVQPTVVFLYTNWCPHAIRAAVEYKEAAYTVVEQGYNASFLAVDCDEDAAARLCSAEVTVTGDVPSLVIFHPHEDEGAALTDAPPAADAHADAATSAGSEDGTPLEGDGDVGEASVTVDMMSRVVSVADLDLMKKAPELTLWVKERIDEHRAATAEPQEGDAFPEGDGSVGDYGDADAGGDANAGDGSGYDAGEQDAARDGDYDDAYSDSEGTHQEL